MAVPDKSAVLDALLESLLTQHGGRQIFVFGPEGEPFWAARTPLEQGEIEQLGRALELIERLETTTPRPFYSHDIDQGLFVGALDSRNDLYFVVLCERLESATARAHAQAIRTALAPHGDLIRAKIRRIVASAG